MAAREETASQQDWAAGARERETESPIGGDGVEIARREAERKAKEDWLASVVVDNLTLRTHQGVQTAKPCQLDKYDDILDGRAHKRGLRTVRNATLPSGKKVLCARRQ